MTDFIASFDPAARGDILDAAHEAFDRGACNFGPEDLGNSDAFGDVVETCEGWFEEWFGDNLDPDDWSDGWTRAEVDYVGVMSVDFAEQVIQDIEDGCDWEQTKRSLMGPI